MLIVFNMMFDVARCLILMVCILLGFAAAMHVLYEKLSNLEQLDYQAPRGCGRPAAPAAGRAATDRLALAAAAGSSRRSSSTASRST